MGTDVQIICRGDLPCLCCEDLCPSLQPCKEKNIRQSKSYVCRNHENKLRKKSKSVRRPATTWYKTHEIWSQLFSWTQQFKKNKWKRLTIKRRHKYHMTFRGFSNVTSNVMENVSHELLFSPLCLKHFLISLLHSVVAFCPNICTMGATCCLLRRFLKTHIRHPHPCHNDNSCTYQP